ncbi:hypothetical protein ACEPAG_3746 [Sanghuangporus baumii]
MPFTRIRPDPRSEGPTVSLRSRLYSSRMARPCNVGVPTRVGNGSMFPVAELVLDDMALQPYIHDTCVVLRRARKVHLFKIFYKNHKWLPRNTSVRQIFYGDAFIMRKGATTSKQYVNLRPGDGELADYIMKRFAELRRRRKGIPKKVEFTKRF